MTVDYASRILFKQVPVDKSKTKCLSHALLLANSFVHQTGKGLFAFLPLGQRVVDKLTKIIEDELRNIGAQKCSLPVIGSEKLWSKSDRWNMYGSCLFRFSDRYKNLVCLQPTCEEMVSDISSSFGPFRQFGLPMMLFQSTDKFRDEMNPRFGLLRSRQFIMNDLYSFDEDEQKAVLTYQRVSDAYRRIFFDRLGLHEILTVQARTGEIGGNISHEYHLPNESAEDRLFRCEECGGQTLQSEIVSCENCPNCNRPMKSLMSVEIAHTFQLGQHYSSMFNVLNTNGSPYFMCCFGIGISRLIAASIDTLTITDKAMRLPVSISPYKLAIVLPRADDTHPSTRFAHDMIRQLDSLDNLTGNILVDDRLSKSIGRRLVELNQLGIPNIVVVTARKSAKPYDLVEMELFRAWPRQDELEPAGLFTHEALLDLSKTF